MNRLWYNKNLLCWMLLPISWVYGLLSRVRRYYLSRYKQTHFPVPVIVVGNLTLGGVGKTPLVIAIANKLSACGIQVGVVSRGYGGRGPFPRDVQLDDCASEVGDEPLLIRQKTACPLVIAPNRVDAVKHLLAHHPVQVIISDDGLQHYTLGRAIEIAVIDGARYFGNGFLFPAGPLREHQKRLKEVDFTVINGGEWMGAYRMDMCPGQLTSLATGQTIDTDALSTPLAAVAGIGNPARFYNTLSAMKIAYNPYPFPDHYQYRPSDLRFNESMLVMTEKDAIKCMTFVTDEMLVLPVTAKLEDVFWDRLWAHEQLKGVFAK